MPGAFLNRGFAFQAPAWSRCALHEVVLRKVFRQQSDQKFLRILQDIRQAPLRPYLLTRPLWGCAPHGYPCCGSWLSSFPGKGLGSLGQSSSISLLPMTTSCG